MFAFSYAKQSYQLLSDGEKELVFELQSSTYNTRTPKGVLKVCKSKNIYINKTYLPAYRYELLSYKNNQNEAKYDLIKEEQICNVIGSSVFGSLVVADCVEDYRDFISNCNIGFSEYIYSSNKNNYSKVIIAPDFRDEALSLPLYDTILFLRKPFSNNVISYINSKTRARIYVVDRSNSADNISLDRSVFAEYYEAVRCVAGVDFTNFFTCYKKIRSTMPGINIQQLAVCVAIFEEMGILKVNRMPYRLQIIPTAKVDLSLSKICKLLS